MAETVNVAGAARVYVDANQGAGLELLGYTIDGVMITKRWFTSDVPGDQNGGSEGPPIDIQQFGEIDLVRIEMSKFDLAVWTKVLARVPTKAEGVIGTAGSLLFGTANSTYRLLIWPTLGQIHNYPLAVPRGPIDNNLGTKFSKPVLEFECHGTGGVIKNVNTS